MISVSSSHPTWVRGLKRVERLQDISDGESHPTWVRGLKLTIGQCHLGVFVVAPYVGAWIETYRLAA